MIELPGRGPNLSPAKANPFLTFMFSVDGVVNGVDMSGYFTELSGLAEECQVVELKTVGKNGTSIQFSLPGRTSRSPITLKRGVTTDMGFWKWWQLVKEGHIYKARTNVSITMYARSYQRLVKWDLESVWPSKITAPNFQAGSSDVGVEELTLVYEALKFEQFPDI